MDSSGVPGIIVAAIASTAAFASQRAASNALKSNAKIDAEKEAYERARGYDTETIRRQDIEILELRKDKLLQSRRVAGLLNQVENLKAIIRRLLRGEQLQPADFKAIEGGE